LHCNFKREKTDIKPYPLSYGLRNPYRNLNYSQDLCPETSTKLYVHEFGFGHIMLSAPAVNLKPALRKDNEEGRAKTQDQ
jgi:hypothetical protein